MFKGVDPLANHATYIYHGDVNYGVFVSRSQMMRHIDKKNWDFMSCIHIGPLVLRPKCRYSNKEILDDSKRRYIVISYPNLRPDMLYISKRNGY